MTREKRREKAHAYYLNNRDKILAAERSKYHADPSKRKAAKKRWVEKDRGHYLNTRKSYYQRNRTKILAQNKAARQGRIAELNEASRLRGIARRRAARKLILSVKKHSVCVRCGFSDPRALVFHHRRGHKDMSIAETIGHNWPKRRILAEMAKCDVLCANCHTIAHSNKKRRGP